MQNYARKTKIPIDQLGFQYDVISVETIIVKKPDNGAYVKGLYMEGARWSAQERVITESHPRILFDSMPVIWLKPNEQVKIAEDLQQCQVYSCPVYKTSARRGVLSTTGHSTNYIISIDLQTDHPQDHWINRGVALLCQLDD